MNYRRPLLGTTVISGGFFFMGFLVCILEPEMYDPKLWAIWMGETGFLFAYAMLLENG